MKAIDWCVGFITAHSCDPGEAVCRAAFQRGDSRLRSETGASLRARKACSPVLALPLLLDSLKKVSQLLKKSLK